MGTSSHNEQNAISRENFYTLGLLKEADKYCFDLLKPLKGKTVLDLGCGSGTYSITIARGGAIVYAVDLSEEMVAKTQALVSEYGLEGRVRVLQMDAHELRFPDETFDYVFGHSVLHHTDLSRTRNEVYRVLKSGGKGVFLEPLGYNLVINLFRRLTPGRRVSTEKPLRFENIVFFAEPFSSLKHREFVFLTLGTLVVSLLGNRAIFERECFPGLQPWIVLCLLVFLALVDMPG